MNKEKKKKLKLYLFELAYIVFFVGIMINSSQYSNLKHFKLFSHLLQVISCIIALIKIFLDVKKINFKKCKINYRFLILYIVLIISFFVSKSKTLVFFAIFILASKDVDFKKIVKTTLFIQIIMLTFIIISCKLGIIEDLIVYRGINMRHSLGTISPNYLMLQVFQFVILILYLYREKINFFILLGLFIFSIIFYQITYSRMGLICIIAVLLFFIINKHFDFKKIFKLFIPLMKFLPLFLFMIMLILTILYKPLNLEKINSLFSNRLELNSVALNKYGINLFGNNIKWIGQTVKSISPVNDYNYIDSSYLNILFNYGIIILIYIFYYLNKLFEYAFLKDDNLLVFILLVSCIYCFFDSWLMGINTNTFLFLICVIEKEMFFKKEEVKNEKNIIN